MSDSSAVPTVLCGLGQVVVSIFVAVFVAAGCGQAVGAGGDATVPTGDGAVDAGLTVTGEPQWAMLGATPLRNGRSGFVGPSQATEQIVDLGGGEGSEELVFVSAVGPEGTVYAVARERNELGRLVSMQPNGSVSWQGAVDVVGGVALTGDGLLLVEGAQQLDPTDPSSPVNMILGLGSNGILLWAGHPYDSGVISREHRHSAPLVDGAGNVYVHLLIGSTPELEHPGYHLCSFEATGAFRWCWDRVVGSSNYVAPAMGPDEILYVVVENEDINVPSDPTSEDGVYTLDHNGAEQWFLPLPNSHLTAIGLGDDGTLYYAAFGMGVFVGSVEAAGGKGWTATFPQRYQSITTSLAITSGAEPDPTIYVGGWHDPDGDGSEGSITALTPAGVERWKFETGGTPCGGLAVDATGAVYALIGQTFMGDYPTRLVGLESDGTQRLSADVGLQMFPGSCLISEVERHVASVVLAQGGRIYVGSSRGQLHILAP